MATSEQPSIDGSHSTDGVLPYLRECLAEVLYCPVEDIPEDTAFQDLGLDSILSAEIAAIVNSHYGLDEKISVIYEHPNLRALSDHVASRIAALRP
ncbi:acyl carrier protein (plasmid) [Streptomyces sp. BI20]|uniref:acyl carrier protein n=1 Tax=Streptomyces sp. BI20 TaxID=3403460 RepID=UPI003C70F52C